MIGARYPGVALGTLARFARDENYDPVDPELRRRLRLPEKRRIVKLDVELCDKCNGTHPVQKDCPRPPVPAWVTLGAAFLGQREKRDA